MMQERWHRALCLLLPGEFCWSKLRNTVCNNWEKFEQSALLLPLPTSGLEDVARNKVWQEMANADLDYVEVILVNCLQLPDGRCLKVVKFQWSILSSYRAGKNMSQNLPDVCLKWKCQLYHGGNKLVGMPVSNVMSLIAFRNLWNFFWKQELCVWATARANWRDQCGTSILLPGHDYLLHELWHN